MLNTNQNELTREDNIKYEDWTLEKKTDEKIIELLLRWHSNITINLLDDQSSWMKGSIPTPLDKCKSI